MSKAICEAIKLTVDSRIQVQQLIEALVDNYDIYIKQVEGRYSDKYEIKLYERDNDE